MEKLRILIVEPRPLVCGSVSGVLRRHGHPLVVSGDPGIVEYVDEFIHVDLVILDLDADASRVGTFNEFLHAERLRNRFVGVACSTVRLGWGEGLPVPPGPSGATRGGAVDVGRGANAPPGRMLVKPVRYAELEQVMAGLPFRPM